MFFCQMGYAGLPPLMFRWLGGEILCAKKLMAGRGRKKRRGLAGRALECVGMSVTSAQAPRETSTFTAVRPSVGSGITLPAIFFPSTTRLFTPLDFAFGFFTVME